MGQKEKDKKENGRKKERLPNNEKNRKNLDKCLEGNKIFSH